MSSEIDYNPLRCACTNNPCGTDTRMTGDPCMCSACRAYTRIAELEEENLIIIKGNVECAEECSKLMDRVEELEARLAAAERQKHFYCTWEDCDQEAMYCEGHAKELINPNLG